MTSAIYCEKKKNPMPPPIIATHAAICFIFDIELRAAYGIIESRYLTILPCVRYMASTPALDKRFMPIPRKNISYLDSLLRGSHRGLDRQEDGCALILLLVL